MNRRIVKYKLERNPFVNIPDWLRFAVALYFIIYILFGNITQLLTEPNIGFEIIMIVFFRIVIGFMVLVPILFFRQMGLIHLFAFPFFISLVKRFIQNPESFITQVVGNGVYLESTIAANLNYYELVNLNLEALIYSFITWVFIFVGFLSFGDFKYKFPIKYKIPSSRRFITFSFILISIVLIFFSIQGGITNWIVQWGEQGGRRNAMEGLGPILRLLTVSYIIPLSWYVFRGKVVFSNPYFLIFFLTTILMGFFVTGSRSSILHGSIPFILVYMIRNKNLPLGRFIGLGAVFFVLFGLLGQIRKTSTYNSGDFSWDKIDFNIEENINNAVEESDKWGSLGADIATYNYVAKGGDYLYGKSYVAFLSFWIPRAIWTTKPHGVGYYTGRDIFNSQSGVPPSSIAEAFWNFDLFGVVLIALFQGLLIRLISDVYMNNPDNMIIILLYVIILATGLQMTSLGLTRILQTLFYALLALKFLRAI